MLRTKGLLAKFDGIVKNPSFNPGQKHEALIKIFLKEKDKALNYTSVSLRIKKINWLEQITFKYQQKIQP